MTVAFLRRVQIFLLTYLLTCTQTGLIPLLMSVKMRCDKLLQNTDRPTDSHRHVRVCTLRSLYVDHNSSSATLYLTRSGYSRKVVIVTYITHQLSRLSLADHDDDVTVAGVRVHPAVEGVDFAGSVSTVALGVDVVSMVYILPPETRGPF